MKKLLIALVPLLGFAFAQDAAPVNKTCPFSGKDIDAGQTITIEKKVAFCCGKCLEKYNEDTAAAAEKVLAAAPQAVNDACPYSGKEVSKTVTIGGQQVGVCCNKCVRKAKADDALEVEATKPPNAECPFSGKPADADQVATASVTVGFCCGKCKGKAEGDPAAVLEKL